MKALLRRIYFRFYLRRLRRDIVELIIDELVTEDE